MKNIVLLPVLLIVMVAMIIYAWMPENDKKWFSRS
jgi:uncharacterized BrkB/YihY/UPF0761 family membrane protein